MRQPNGPHNSRQGTHTLEVQQFETAAYTLGGFACNNSERADVDDLEGGGELFDTGQICHLPLVPLEGKHPRWLCLSPSMLHTEYQEPLTRPNEETAILLRSQNVLKRSEACAGIVLMPGDTLPLKMVSRQDQLGLESALSAPAPFTRLLAVVRGSSH